MPSNPKRVDEVCRHIDRIKAGDYPAIAGRDADYRIVERPWRDLPETSKLAILNNAVDWSGITNRDKAHILLSEIDPAKIADVQRNQLVGMAEGRPTLSDILAGKWNVVAQEREQGRERDRGIER